MRVGTTPGITSSLSLTSPKCGNRPDQPLGVRMLWSVEERPDVGLLDDLPGVHNGHPIGHLCHQPQVVGDEDHRGARVTLQVEDQVEDLRLDGHIERRRGLVGDQQFRLERQCHGDHHPLCHPTRHLVGIETGASPRIWDPHLGEHCHRLLLANLVRHVPMDFVNLGDLPADLVHRVERRSRLLEDHRYPVAPQLGHLVARHAGQVAPVEHDAAGHDLPGTGHQPHDRERCDRLSAARLADQTEHLSTVDVEVDPVHRPDDPVPREEMRLQIADLEEMAVLIRFGPSSAVFVLLLLPLTH